MRFQIKSKNLSLTKALQEYAQKKLSRIQKHFNPVLSGDVLLSTERGFHIADVKVHVKGTFFRGIEKTKDMYSSIDQVVDKLERQVQKYKEKLKNKHPHKEPHEFLGSPSGLLPPPDGNGAAVRQQTLSTLIPEEAAQKMEGLGYHFYLFRNRDSEEVNLVYRRENGEFAFIEPRV